MRAIVYFGPSIERQRVCEIITATHAGPIKRGDLERAGGHDLVVILDGEFGQNLSVSPKEILALLDTGKTVIGAASMGALRASELDCFGMRGIGWIYDRFRHAPVRRDDDVALTYSPVDGRAFTIPMVNVEFWIEWLDQFGDVTRKEGARIRSTARRIFFAERTSEILVQAWEEAIGRERLRDLMRQSGGIPDIKRRDAETALQFAARLLHN